ncbi:hypothetical protein AYO20_04645 [Fonsecaea nubica]|uniref:DUF7918 domain-containing protein n=1 Tax=Fonsecaea nubica TaxID=856822 RepID=A0A178D3P0_9EURO|nr:hypothetical protein AYO20_04645 [Fonsecaea nubica]OAL35984.1 hypothetical protein AYO20_04645 [Fonsecaea nubica]
MPCEDFIDVSVHVDGAPLAEYADPEAADSKNATKFATTRYVEVKAGQKFAVHVKLLPGFKFHSATHLRAALYIDQESRATTKTIKLPPNCPVHANVLRTERECQIESRLMLDETTGTWSTYDLQFGDLAVKDDWFLSDDEIESGDFSSLGTLHVKVFRATKVLRHQPFTYTANLKKPLDEVSETALKGRDVSNNVKYVVKTTAPPPRPGLWNYYPLDDWRGSPYEFVFHYRNRRVLQTLGCIPRTPSPPPNLAVKLERTEEKPKMKKENSQKQISESQVRLGWAECGNCGNGDVGTNVIPAKRTWDETKLEDDHDQEEDVKLALVPIHKRVVIDLTND